MSEHQASRTLVKSPPELWAECSVAASLARHLGELGEIRITKLEPETSVAWEGEAACGTVRLEPSGWGTRVILTAVEGGPPEEPPAPEEPATATLPPVPGLAEVLFAEPALPTVLVAPRPVEREGFLARLRRRLLGHRAAAWGLEGARAGAVASPRPAEPPVPEAPGLEESRHPLDGVLTAALDSLGRAHHRPFSRA